MGCRVARTIFDIRSTPQQGPTFGYSITDSAYLDYGDFVLHERLGPDPTVVKIMVDSGLRYLSTGLVGTV